MATATEWKDIEAGPGQTGWQDVSATPSPQPFQPPEHPLIAALKMAGRAFIEPTQPVSEVARMAAVETQPYSRFGINLTPENVPREIPGRLTQIGRAAGEALTIPGLRVSPTLEAIPSVRETIAKLFGRRQQATPGVIAPPTVEAPPIRPAEVPAIAAPGEPPPIPTSGGLPTLPGGFTPRVSVPLTGNIAEAAKGEAEALASTSAAAQNKRLFRQVAEAMESGEIVTSDLPGVLQNSGLTLTEFVTQYKDTISSSGRQLQQLSALRKSLARLVESDPDAAQAFKALEFVSPPTAWDQFKSLYRRVDDVRRASLTTQFATTARNVISQTGRYSLEVIDTSLQKLIGGEGASAALSNGVEGITRFFANLTPTTRAQVLRTLDAFPLEAARLAATPTGEVTLGSRYARLINAFNGMQEQFFRRATFDATVRSGLRARGLDVEAALAQPAGIPVDLIQSATNRALETTFAAIPKGGLGRDILDVYQKLPILTTVQPFPRFMTNAYKFLTDFSPAGYLKLMGRNAEGVFAAADPSARAKILSRASLGTSLLAAGLAIRKSDLGGERWWQIKVGDTTLDTRPFAPFSTYLFMAEVMDTMAEYGVAVVRDGKTMEEALRARGMTTQDVVQGALSINRIAGTGLVAVDLIREGALDRKLDLLRDFAAQYVAGFTVPFRTIKDAVAGFSPDEATIRDSRQQFMDPAMANLPTLSQRLPEAASPLRGEPRQTETPWLRQLTGISLTTRRGIEREVDRLGLEFQRIGTRTGIPEADRQLNEQMGKWVQKNDELILGNPAYIRAPQAMQRIILTAFFAGGRQVARTALNKQQPELMARVALRGLDNDTLDVVMSIEGPAQQKLRELLTPRRGPTFDDLRQDIEAAARLH